MFRNKTILITGASSGIGRALARRLAHSAGHLILVARRSERLTALAEEVKMEKGHTTCIPADLIEPEACERVIDEATASVGPVDVLIHSAGVGEYGRLTDMDFAAADRMMRLNMTALVRLTHLVLPQMIERRSGHLMSIASTAALAPTPYMAVYGATKSFVLHFSLALWEEVRSQGIRVTCLIPGPVDTEFFDRGGYETRKGDFTRISLDPDWLADVAVKKMADGCPAYIPGWVNKLCGRLQRLLPLRTVTRLTGRVLRPK